MPHPHRRAVVRVGDGLAVLLSADEARALNAVEGGEIESRIVPGAVELQPVARYAEMSEAERWSIIEKHRTRR